MSIKKILNTFVLFVLYKSRIKEYNYNADFIFNSLKRSLLEDDYEIEVANKDKGYILAIKFYKMDYFKINRTFETLILKRRKTKLNTKVEIWDSRRRLL